MKKSFQDRLGLKMFFTFFALLALSLACADAQTKQDFTHAGSLATARCRDGQLSVKEVNEDAAMGGVRVVNYSFTNTSHSPCTLEGYPRYELLNKAGQPVRGGRAKSGIDMLGDDLKKRPELVTVEPGQTAAFVVYYNAGGAGYMGKPCPTYRKVRVTAPGTRRAMVLRDDIQYCSSLEVSPVLSKWPLE